MRIQVREYGSSGPVVILLHGGPGAPGYLAPVARELAGSFRVLEPFQRRSGKKPLTVARHVSDLDELVKSHCAERRPAIVGHSWGAMLALAYAAVHPDGVACLALIGCGTFDSVARNHMEANRNARIDKTRRDQMKHFVREIPDPDERLRALGRLIRQIDSFVLISAEDETEVCDARGHEETWQDMLRLQDEGVYPSSFASIRSPVIMMHGALDPHPGRLIHAGLAPHMPHLEYREWEQCGHYPWLEKAVRDDFYSTLQAWLRRNMTSGKSTPSSN